MKKHYFLTFLSILLLGTLILAQTIAVTSVLKAEESSTATSYTNKYWDVTGKELPTAKATKIQKLLSSIKNVERFVVYANKIDRTNHIEGNVFVNEVESTTNLVITRVFEKQTGDYSYVGKATVPIQLSDGEKIILGSKISLSKPNQNQTIINGGYSNNINVVQLSDENTHQNEKLINNTLNEISKAGENSKDTVDTSFFYNCNNSFESVAAMLEGQIATSTNVSKNFNGGVISINVDYKQLLNNEGAFSKLINNNHGTRIVVNVLFPSTVPNSINIMKAFSANTKVSTDFNKFSPYIIWNFGNYSGNITINEEMLGIIVAPNATVYQAAGNLNGQIIANVAGNNGELHQVTVTPAVPGIPDEPEKPIETETEEKPKPSEETEKSTETEIQESETEEETSESSESSEKQENSSETEIKENKTEEKKSESSEKTEKSSETEESKVVDVPLPPATPPYTPEEPSTESKNNKDEKEEAKEHKKSSDNEEKKQDKKRTKDMNSSRKIKKGDTNYAPKTGDVSIVFGFIIIGLLGLSFIFYILFSSRRKK